MIFDFTNCGSDILDNISCIAGFTDIGFGSMLGIVMLVVFSAVLFLMMRVYGNERAFGVTFLLSAFMAFLMRRLHFINDSVLTVTIILAVIGVILLIKEAAQYEN